MGKGEADDDWIKIWLIIFKRQMDGRLHDFS
jgi:hypothetical protein